MTNFANRLAHFGNVPQRITYSESFGYGIIAYGRNNSYPQEVRYAVQRSSTASACARLFAEFLYGAGFANGGNVIVNNEGYTLNDILLRVCRDYALFYGFAVRTNYNLLGRYTDMQVEPFEQIRLCIPNDAEKLAAPTAVKISDDWGGESWRNNANPAMAERVMLFNPAELETEDLEAFKKANGQVMYATINDCFYPESPFDAVMEQVLTSGDISDFDRQFVKNGFSASRVFLNKEASPTEEAYQRNLQMISQMAGTANAGGVFYLEGMELELLDTMVGQKHADQYTAMREALKDDILEAMNIPAILVGRSKQSTGFHNADEIVNAYDFYNSTTQVHRDLITRYFQDLIDNFAAPILPAGERLSIMPKRFISSINRTAL